MKQSILLPASHAMVTPASPTTHSPTSTHGPTTCLTIDDLDRTFRTRAKIYGKASSTSPGYEALHSPITSPTIQSTRSLPSPPPSYAKGRTDPPPRYSHGSTAYLTIIDLFERFRIRAKARTYLTMGDLDRIFRAKAYGKASSTSPGYEAIHSQMTSPFRIDARKSSEKMPPIECVA